MRLAPQIWTRVAVASLLTSLLTVNGTNFSPHGAIAADVANGKAIYESKCLVCHGRTGKGDGPLAKSLSPPPPSLLGKEAIARFDAEGKEVIREGRGSMPSYKGKFSGEAIEDVLAYTRSLQGRR